MKQKLIILLSIIILIFSIKLGTTTISYSNAYSYYGSKSGEVYQIQSKLKSWGYYEGNLDSIYGYSTFQAVKKFQSKNGLTVDGICGDSTLAALGITSKTATSDSSSNASRGSTDRNLSLMAHLIHGEARGEPYLGQVAVGAVIINRTRDSRFPHTIPGVIYQSGAFDAVSDGQINLPASDSSFKAARDAMNGWDPTSGCIYYYNPVTATSKWIVSRPIVLKIGKHNFAK